METWGTFQGECTEQMINTINYVQFGIAKKNSFNNT